MEHISTILPRLQARCEPQEFDGLSDNEIVDIGYDASESVERRTGALRAVLIRNGLADEVMSLAAHLLDGVSLTMRNEVYELLCSWLHHCKRPVSAEWSARCCGWANDGDSNVRQRLLAAVKGEPNPWLRPMCWLVRAGLDDESIYNEATKYLETRKPTSTTTRAARQACRLDAFVRRTATAVVCGEQSLPPMI